MNILSGDYLRVIFCVKMHTDKSSFCDDIFSLDDLLPPGVVIIPAPARVMIKPAPTVVKIISAPPGVMIEPPGVMIASPGVMIAPASRSCT